MNKISLSETFLFHHFKPKKLNVFNEDLKKFILTHNLILDNDIFCDANKKYFSLNFHKQLQWLRDFYSDELSFLLNKRLFHFKTCALVLKSNESLDLHNHNDRWDLPNQSDVSALYVVSQDNFQSKLIFEYDNNRFIDKKYQIPLENDKIIIFNSTLNHKITKNENKNNTIFLSFRYQFIN